MNREDYEAATQAGLSALLGDARFANSRAQVRARAVQAELVPQSPEVAFGFDANLVWRQCNHMISVGGRLLQRGAGQREQVLASRKIAAETLESLAGFADDSDRDLLLLASAMSYHVAGYQASAQCLARLLSLRLHDVAVEGDEHSIDAELVSRYRSALIAFLMRNVSALEETTSEALSFIRGCQENIIQQISAGQLSFIQVLDLVAHASLQEGLYSLARYCLDGEYEEFWHARDEIESSRKRFMDGADVRLATITHELGTVADSFFERSTWHSIMEHCPTLLTDPVWKVYLSSLASDDCIVEFWQSQLKALQSGILSSGDSFVIQMPTSAGKTLVAELCMLAALTSAGGARALYIAPYRALAREVETGLARRLGALGYRVSNLIGSFEIDSFQSFLLTESDILVVTPEKADLLLRTHPEFFTNVAVVVVDEGHLLDEGFPSPDDYTPGAGLAHELEQRGTLGRGILLEFLVARLRQELPNARFLFMSAVMPEVSVNDIARWLSSAGTAPLVVDPSARPSRQLLAKFKWRSAANGELQCADLADPRMRRSFFVPYFLQRKQYPTGERTPTGRPQRRSWPDIGNKAQTTGMLAARFAATGPVLVFCAQVNHVKGVTENVITSLRYLRGAGELPANAFSLADEANTASLQAAIHWLGEAHPLVNALRHGVGMHYGRLPERVRQAVEEDFRSEKIRILVSTNTLGQGVNLPVKTAIIYSLLRTWGYDSETGQLLSEKVAKRDFWNICGRAGRAGQETEGRVVFVSASENDESLYGEFTDQQNIEQVDSGLLKLLRALVSQRITQDELLQYLDPHVLAILAEEVVDTDDEEQIAEFLGQSLVGVQAQREGLPLEPLVSAVGRASARVISEVPDAAVRHLFATTGLSVASCQALADAVDDFFLSATDDAVPADEAEAGYLNCNWTLLESGFEACRDLREMRPASRYQIPEPEVEVLHRWVAGEPIGALHPTSRTAEDVENLSEYVADRLMYKLPWGLNAFVAILLSRLEATGQPPPPSWMHLPTMVKFGVPHVVACWAMSLGAPSREFALELARRYEDTSGSFGSFVRWVANLPYEFIIEEIDRPENERRSFVQERDKIVCGNELLISIRGEARELRSPVQGIRYHGRAEAAVQVQEGDDLALEAEPDNSWDAYAIRVLFRGTHIGYVQRDKAKILARQMRLGKVVHAYAAQVSPPSVERPYPRIEMAVALD